MRAVESAAHMRRVTLNWLKDKDEGGVADIMETLKDWLLDTTTIRQEAQEHLEKHGMFRGFHWVNGREDEFGFTD